MKIGDRVALKINRILDEVRFRGAWLSARGTIREVTAFVYIDWDPNYRGEISRGGWMESSLIPEDRVHMENL